MPAPQKLIYLTPRWGPQDLRLKVLWIEDESTETLPPGAERYFVIMRAYVPAQIAEALRQQVIDIKAKREEVSIYDFNEFPFDGYLSDFNLAKAPRVDEQTLLPRIAIPGFEEEMSSVEDSSEADKIENDPASLASQAEAAGLTSAVLSALNFETHPAVVVPYTAYTDHLSKQRALIQLLAPRSLVITHGVEEDLSKEDLGKKLTQFAKAYRNNLPRWALLGFIHVPRDETRRLVELITSRTVGVGEGSQVHWEEDDSIVIHTLYGRRGISCRAIWFNYEGRAYSSQEVLKWLAEFPLPSSQYEEARRLAFKYLELRASEECALRYDLSRIIRSLNSKRKNPEDDERKRFRIKEICELIGIDPKAAIHDPKGLEVIQSGWRAPHLFELCINDEVKRLAALMLVTMAFARSWAFSGDDAVSTSRETLKRFLEKIKDKRYQAKLVRKVPEILETPRDELEEIYHLLILLDIRTLIIEGGEIRVPEVPPLRPEDIVSFIDPLPQQLLTVEHDFSGQRIGHAFERYGLNIPELFRNTGDGGISPEELRELQNFALDIMYPINCWPEWLRKGIL